MQPHPEILIVVDVHLTNELLYKGGHNKTGANISLNTEYGLPRVDIYFIAELHSLPRVS